MKLVASLVPSASDVVRSLGFGDQLVGVSHECDPCQGCDASPTVVTLAKFDHEDASQVEIGAIYRASQSDEFILGQYGNTSADRAFARLRLCSYFWTDMDAIAELQPDLILTCIDESQMSTYDDVELAVRSALRRPNVEIINYNPQNLGEVFALTLRVAKTLGDEERGSDLITDFHQRLSAAVAFKSSLTSAMPTVAVVQWVDPLFMTGGWVPEILAKIKAKSLFCIDASPSVATSWREVKRHNPDFVIFALCGLSVDESQREIQQLQREDRDFASLEAKMRANRIVAVDAKKLFSRPSPASLLDTTRVLVDILSHGHGRSSSAGPSLALSSLWRVVTSTKKIPVTAK